MKRIILVSIFCLLAVFPNKASIYAEPQATTDRLSTPEVITIENASIERKQIAELKRIAEHDSITFEQALDDYLSELVNAKLSDDYEEVHNEEVTILHPNVEIDGITLSEIEDLKIIAEMENLSLDEAIDRYAWQTQFIQVADKLEEKYPDTFAGAVFEKDGSGAWFAFKHDIPKDAISAVNELPATIKLYGQRGFSEMELKSKLDLVHYNTLMHDGVIDVHSYYDIDTGYITIEAQPKEVLSTVEKSIIKSEIQKKHSQNNLINIKINFVDEIDGGEDRSTMRGGAYLDTCTTGFTVRSNTGVAVTTAHHCSGGTRVYENHFSGTSILSRITSHAGIYGDLAVYSNPSMSAIPFFYSNYNMGRYTEGMGSPRVGINVCKFGKKSGTSCDKVYRLNTARGSYSGMAATENRRADRGDSGGPWYYGNAAFGVHSGRATIGSSLRDQFSLVSNIPSALRGYRLFTN